MPGKRKRSYSYGRKGRGAKRARRSSVFSSMSRYSSASGRVHARPVASLSTWTNPGSLPDTLRVKVRTYSSFQLTSTTGSLTATTIKANSLLVPFTAMSGTNEPPAAGNLRVLFQYYRVLASAIELRFYPYSSNEVGMWVGIAPEMKAGGYSISNTPTKLMSGMRSKFRIFPSMNGAGAYPVFALKHYATSAEISGQTQQQVMNDGGWAAQTNSSSDFADPVLNWYWTFMYQSADGTTTSNIGCDVILTQYVQFEGRTPGNG